MRRVAHVHLSPSLISNSFMREAIIYILTYKGKNIILHEPVIMPLYSNTKPTYGVLIK